MDKTSKSSEVDKTAPRKTVNECVVEYSVKVFVASDG
jgi:hypothetical protein